MANPYYNATGSPGTKTKINSAPIRAEAAAVAAAFDKLPTLTALNIVRVNAAGTGLEPISSLNAIPIGPTTPSTGAFTTLSTTGLATLNSATVTGALVAGSINTTPIGATTPSTGAFTTLSSTGAATLNSLTVTNAITVTSGTINNTSIGATTANTGRFSTLTTTGAANFASLDSTPIGATTASTGRFTTLTSTGAATLNSATVTGALAAGSIDSTPIGATTASTGRFSTLTTTGAATLAAGSSLAAGSTITNPINTSQTLTDAATVAWNLDSGAVATLTATGGVGATRAMGTPTNMRVGTFILKWVQDATGGRSLTFNATWKTTNGTPPGFSTTANAINIISGYCDGTTMFYSLAVFAAA